MVACFESDEIRVHDSKPDENQFPSADTAWRRLRKEVSMSLQVILFLGIIMVALLLRMYIEYLEEK